MTTYGVTAARKNFSNALPASQVHRRIAYTYRLLRLWASDLFYSGLERVDRVLMDISPGCGIGHDESFQREAPSSVHTSSVPTRAGVARVDRR